MATETHYAKEDTVLPYNVTFIERSTGKKLTRGFDSEYAARVFANKLKYSKRCTLISCPIFR